MLETPATLLKNLKAGRQHSFVCQVFITATNYARNFCSGIRRVIASNAPITGLDIP
jgi:hypothetical protein